MDSALTPREIQSRIRAGESPDDVARAAGVPVDGIEGYAAPVLAEREHMAEMAQAA
ncbi:PF11268 domain protein, partial [Propionibacterium acidifaciens F0233]